MTDDLALKFMPKLLVDECCRDSLIVELRRHGFNVTAIREISPGVSDVDVLKIAATQNRLLITDDKDFGDLVVRATMPVPGVVLVRTSSDDGAEQARRIVSVLRTAAERVFGHITIIEDTRFRHRPL